MKIAADIQPSAETYLNSVSLGNTFLHCLIIQQLIIYIKKIGDFFYCTKKTSTVSSGDGSKMEEEEISAVCIAGTFCCAILRI